MKHEKWPRGIIKALVERGNFDANYNNIKFGLVLKLTYKGTLYERKVTTILDLLGNVGGVIEAIHLICMFILYFV